MVCVGTVSCGYHLLRTQSRTCSTSDAEQGAFTERVIPHEGAAGTRRVSILLEYVRFSRSWLARTLLRSWRKDGASILVDFSLHLCDP